jgi:DNA-binding LacI/PurR family transcriptional regulator
VGLPFVGAELFSKLLTGLDEGAQERGYLLVVSISHRHAGEFRAAMRAIEKRVDGMVVTASESKATGHPPVTTGFSAPTRKKPPGVRLVRPDHLEGGAPAPARGAAGIRRDPERSRRGRRP